MVIHFSSQDCSILRFVILVSSSPIYIDGASLLTVLFNRVVSSVPPVANDIRSRYQSKAVSGRGCKRGIGEGTQLYSPSSVATPSAVYAVLGQRKKKQKLTVLDKTKKVWGYKEKNNGVEAEFDKYKKSSGKYLDKFSFLERADYRQVEKERDAHLALLSKRRQDDV